MSYVDRVLALLILDKNFERYIRSHGDVVEMFTQTPWQDRGKLETLAEIIFQMYQLDKILQEEW